MQFLRGHSGQAFRFGFTDRAAVDRPQEKIQQTLAGGGIVEHVAHQRGLRRLLHKIFQPRSRRIQPLEKK